MQQDTPIDTEAINQNERPMAQPILGSTVVEPTNTPQKSKKLLTISILAVIILVVAIGGFVLFRRSDESSVLLIQDQPSATTPNESESTASIVPDGYAEYKNPDLGIRFIYPQEWGEVATTKKARYAPNDQLEPIKSHVLNFSDNSDTLIIMSPVTWDGATIFSEGIPAHLAFAMTDEVFKAHRDSPPSAGTFRIFSTDSSYLHIFTDGNFLGNTRLEGAVHLDLPEIQVRYAEFFWPIVDGAICNTGEFKEYASLSCYSDDTRTDAELLLKSFQAL